MMLPTHALAGIALAVPLAVVSPELGVFALVGALIGGILPDLDMYAGHRRTLHYPTLYPIAALPAAAAAFVWTTPLTVALAFGLAAAALHCRMDVFGGGLELRPWEASSEKAVYDHVRGEWLAPRRWVRYDGSPGDLGLSVGLGALLFVVLDGPFTAVVVAFVAIAVVYVLLRRQLANLAPIVFGRVPTPFATYVPARYRQE